MNNNSGQPSDSWDPLLRRLLRANSIIRRKEEEERLISEFFYPLIKGFISRKCSNHQRGFQERDALLSKLMDAVIRILSRADVSESPIRRLKPFTLRTFTNAFKDLLKSTEEGKERRKIENRLRRLLDKKAGVMTLSTQPNGTRWIGLVEWDTSKPVSSDYGKLLADPKLFLESKPEYGLDPVDDFIDFLLAIFEAIDCPIEFQDLITVISRLEPAFVSTSRATMDNIPGRGAGPSKHIKDEDLQVVRERCRFLWEQIQSEAHIEDRRAILLNPTAFSLKGHFSPTGLSLLQILLMGGATDLDKVSGVLGITPAKLHSMLENGLPSVEEHLAEFYEPRELPLFVGDAEKIEKQRQQWHQQWHQSIYNRRMIVKRRLRMELIKHLEHLAEAKAVIKSEA